MTTMPTLEIKKRRHEGFTKATQVHAALMEMGGEGGTGGLQEGGGQSKVPVGAGAAWGSRNVGLEQRKEVERGGWIERGSKGGSGDSWERKGRWERTDRRLRRRQEGQPLFLAQARAATQETLPTRESPPD